MEGGADDTYVKRLFFHHYQVRQKQVLEQERFRQQQALEEQRYRQQMQQQEEFRRQRKVEQERQQELLRQQREIERRKREIEMMAAKVAKEAVALTAKKKEAVDAEQRRLEEKQREELRLHQEQLAEQQRMLEEQELKLEAERREQNLRLERQKEDQERQRQELERQQMQKKQKLEEEQMRRQEEMEKRLQMDMQRKLRERQERLNREQAELHQKLEKQREKIREAEEKAEKGDAPSSYVVSTTDTKEVNVPKTVSKGTPSALSVTPARATPMTNGIIKAGVKTPSLSREDLTLPLKTCASTFTPMAPTSSVPKHAKTASKLPPRPWDYDDYFYQDEEGNWQNEYDDEGYEFDPDVYEGDDDGDDYYKENGAFEETGKRASRKSSVVAMSVTESRRESLAASEKRSSIASSQHMNGHDVGSRRPSTIAPSVIHSANGQDVGSRRTSTIAPSVIPSAAASRRGSAAVTAVAETVAKASPTPSVLKPVTNGAKLPPRPLDYDDYYYQDEDGNWQNEYDDEGYEFDPYLYEGDEEGSRRESLAFSEKRQSVVSAQLVNGSTVGSRRASTVAPPTAVPSVAASRRESTASRASLATVVPPPPAVITSAPDHVAQQTPPIQVDPAPYEEEFVEEDEEWMEEEDYDEVVPEYVPEETNETAKAADEAAKAAADAANAAAEASKNLMKGFSSFGGGIMASLSTTAPKQKLQEEVPKVAEEVAATELQSADAPQKELPPRPWDYDDYYYQDEDGNWRNEYDDEGYEFDPEKYEEAKDEEFYTEEEIKDAEEKMQLGTQNTDVAMTVAEPSYEQNQDQVNSLFLARLNALSPNSKVSLSTIHWII